MNRSIHRYPLHDSTQAGSKSTYYPMINEPSQEQLHQLPAYGANEAETAEDILIHGHFFLPAGRFDW